MQASRGELPSELADPTGLDQFGTAYSDTLFDTFSDFTADDNHYQALPMLAFNSQSPGENIVVWSHDAPSLALDEQSPAGQYYDTVHPSEVSLNASVRGPNGHIPWQDTTEPWRGDGNINLIPEGTCTPETTSGAGSRGYKPITSQAREKPRTTPGKTNDGQLLLACPFQRLDAHKHRRCSKYLLRRIKDVKQHVYRCHTQPEYYCALCFDVFETASERDEHIRRAGCDKRPVHWFHGISDEQRRSLSRKASSTLDTEEQWSEIWKLIFPGQQRPKSVWICSPSEEAVSAMRILWNNKGTRILKGVLANSGAVAVQPLLLDAVVNSVFDRLETESGLAPDNNGWPSPARPVVSHGQAPDGICASATH